MSKEIKLEEYTLVYEITSLPYLIFVKAVPANLVYDLSEIEIPSQLKAAVFDCRFILFNNKGEPVDFVAEMGSALTVKTISNMTPLKMINKLKGKEE